MPTKDMKVSFLLNGGVDNRSLDELVAPLVKQGDSPLLKKSTNTRLGVTPGGVTRSPLATPITTGSIPDAARAIVSAAAGQNTLVLPGPDVLGLPQLIPDAGRQAGVSATVIGTLQDRSYQNGVLPVQVVASENVASAKSVSQFAASYNASSNRIWYAYLTGDGLTGSSTSYTGQDWVMVGLATVDGIAVCNLTTVVQLTQPANRWIGLTSHGASGDRIWYVNNAGAICYRPLSYTAGPPGGASAGAEFVVLTPGSLTAGIDVAALDDTFAVLVHSRVGVAADGSVSKININNGTTAAQANIVSAMLGGGDCAVCCASPEGNLRVATVFSAVTGSSATARVYNDTLGGVSISTPVTCHGRVAIGFNHNDSASSGGIVPQVSLAYERNFPLQGLVVRSEPCVEHVFIEMTTGTVGFPDQLGWYRIAGRAAVWRISNQMLFTIHQLVPRRALANESPGAANYVDDPSLDFFWCRSSANFAPISMIARLGTVRGSSAPVDHLYTDKFASNSLVCVGDDLHCLYRLLQDFSGVANGSTRGRHSVLRLGTLPGQLTVAHDRDGCGLLAAALPLQWDGQSVAEFGAPVHTPHLIADVVTSGGTVLTPAGTYSFQAVIYWTDASGLFHRSRPSVLRTVTVNGTTERVALYVALPKTYIPSAFEARIYSTIASGTSLHLMAVLSSRTTFAWFSTFATSVTTANAQIFSGGGNGEEIVPQPPPPAWDIAIIGSRCWIVDAENRSRSVYSKLRVAGVGYEFTPGFEVILPSGAGKLMANREWQGLTVLLTERAVYQVSGDGPSNTLGGGGSFSAPVKIADIGCSNTSSVVVCPAGILWQFGNRFVMLDGSGVHFVASFQATHDVSAALCLTRFAEVLFFSLTTAEIRVYNYENGRWTPWDSQTLPELVRAAHVLPYDVDCAVLSLGSGPTTFKRLEANSTSTATNMVWETDWLLLGGDFHDCVLLRWVIFNGALAGAHDIRIELFADYATTADTDRSWSNAELDARDVNGNYSVRLEPRTLTCRALKVRVTDTRVAGAGCSPRSLTIVYALDGIVREDAFPQGMDK